jgi:uncharacterized protein
MSVLTGTAATGATADIERVVAEIRDTSRGASVAVAFSGGLDSTTVAALARDALGPDDVMLVTVNMGEYAYRRGNRIVLEMADQLGLRQRCLLGQGMQHVVQRGGPACNRCTREIKLGMVRAAARGRLVLTGANRSDTWGKMGLKISNGYYAPLLDLEKPQIRAMADALGLSIPKIGEHAGREGCKLKHLLKPLANPQYHGRAVAEANEIVLDALAEHGFTAELANVKIIGPLRRNIGLVNIKPEPPEEILTAVVDALGAVEALDEVRVVAGPLRLVVKAGPGLAGDETGRYWVEHGRLAPDFAHPIEVEWRPVADGRLHTFHVLDAVPL